MFTARRQLSLVFSTIAALGLLLGSFGLTPAVAAGTGPTPRRPFSKTGPRIALTNALSATHFSCQDAALDSSDGPRCYSPQQIQTAYNVTPLLNHGLNGAGQTIVIIGAASNPYIQQDLAIFDQVFGLPAPNFQVIAPYGAAPFDFNDDYDVGWATEISLDVELAHAMAPDAKIVLALLPPDDNGWNEVLRYVVEHNLGDVISESIAEPENCLGPKSLAAQHLIYLAATLRHMSVVAAAGDDGAANPTCDGSGLIKAASYPAADPFVLAVGGTNLNADAAGNYVGERAWADVYSGCWPTDQFGCSGGGYSAVFQRPFYQAGVAHIQGNRRALPDVAFDGGFDGGVLFHSGVALQVYFGLDPNDTSNFFLAAGTSFGAPQWAGLTAIADQAAGHRLGWLNPAIYRLAANPELYAAAFHDITTGNNNYADVPGYPAQSHWDAVTGWGTPNAAVLLPLLNQLHDNHDDTRGDQ